jgi:hypothetical protein
VALDVKYGKFRRRLTQWWRRLRGKHRQPTLTHAELEKYKEQLEAVYRHASANWGEIANDDYIIWGDDGTD